jgi:hypothetical protein
MVTNTKRADWAKYLFLSFQIWRGIMLPTKIVGDLKISIKLIFSQESIKE